MRVRSANWARIKKDTINPSTYTTPLTRYFSSVDDGEVNILMRPVFEVSLLKAIEAIIGPIIVRMP